MNENESFVLIGMPTLVLGCYVTIVCTMLALVIGAKKQARKAAENAREESNKAEAYSDEAQATILQSHSEYPMLLEQIVNGFVQLESAIEIVKALHVEENQEIADSLGVTSAKTAELRVQTEILMCTYRVCYGSDHRRSLSDLNILREQGDSYTADCLERCMKRRLKTLPNILIKAMNDTIIELRRRAI